MREPNTRFRKSSNPLGRVTLCRGGPACPPVLVEAEYAPWADTQVRPYTNHINTKSPAIRRCNTSIMIVRGPTNHSRGSKGQSPERPTDARRRLIYRPLVGRTRRIYNLQSDLPRGEVVPPCTPLCSPQSFGVLLLRLGAMIRPTASGRFLRHLHSPYCTTAGRVVMCRDAWECLAGARPLCQRLQCQCFDSNVRIPVLQRTHEPCVSTNRHSSSHTS